MGGSHIQRFDEIPWHVPAPRRKETDLDTPPAPGQPGRKFLVEGGGGFYVQAVRLPPHAEAPRHHHDQAEVFLVVEGACRFNGEPMGPLDSVVVEAGEDYGFVAGGEGVTFLVTRGAVAEYREAE